MIKKIIDTSLDKDSDKRQSKPSVNGQLYFSQVRKIGEFAFEITRGFNFQDEERKCCRGHHICGLIGRLLLHRPSFRWRLKAWFVSWMCIDRHLRDSAPSIRSPLFKHLVKDMFLSYTTFSKIVYQIYLSCRANFYLTLNWTESQSNFLNTDAGLCSIPFLQVVL